MADHIPFITTARRYCHQACLLVCYSVHQFVTLVVISLKSTTPIFVRFGMDVQHWRQMSLLRLERSRSTFKVISFKNGPPVTVIQNVNTDPVSEHPSNGQKYVM